MFYQLSDFFAKKLFAKYYDNSLYNIEETVAEYKKQEKIIIIIRIIMCVALGFLTNWLNTVFFSIIYILAGLYIRKDIRGVWRSNKADKILIEDVTLKHVFLQSQIASAIYFVLITNLKPEWAFESGVFGAGIMGMIAFRNSFSPRSMIAAAFSPILILVGLGIYALFSQKTGASFFSPFYFALSFILICSFSVQYKYRNALALKIANEKAQTAQNELDEFTRIKAERDLLDKDAGIGFFRWFFQDDWGEWSEGAYRAFGYPANTSRIADPSFFDKIHADDIAAVDEALEKFKADGISCFINLRMNTYDGDINYIKLHCSAILDEDNKISGIEGVVIDNTPLEKSLLKEKKAVENANLANKAKSEFLANMSHEIRTPLNGILAVSSMLSRSELNDNQMELVKIIIDSSDKLNIIIDDILDIAKVESGRLEIVETAFDLKETLRGTIALFALKAKEKSLSISDNIDELSNASFIGDAGRIRQVVSNLLSNAIKFTDQGNIDISVSINEALDDYKQIIIKVKDDGIGIAPDAIEKLFNRFEQVDNSITRKYGGSGLGLAISNAIMKLMGGQISVSSQAQKGSVFTISFKLKTAEVKPVYENIEETNIEVERKENLSILGVDDNATNRKILELTLAPLEVQLVLSENGLEAIKAFKSKKFDIILMDLQMPIMDGLSAIREIRKIEKENSKNPVPIIAVSANAMTHQIEEAKQAGANHHIAKPFTPTTLYEAIENSLS